ncbi:hypothetical protein [Burkholderia sp. Ac-20379]|uniref:hypothetical protein n=1 Tax=Burkholderia sp. Ac-20379 TaxID=2703900 RepID=UPI00197E82B6|nr:hypothetical protein [Burkholderia sp. Ac-20379]MBN3726487.1 hypothetical protein [Burkholderia sp. Ac-20379]
MNVDWDEFADRYAQLVSVEHANRDTINKLLGLAASKLPRDTAATLVWFDSALSTTSKKWFVAGVMRYANPVPRSLLDPLLTAALKEPNPSANQVFITPCIRTFGHQTVEARIRELASAPEANYGDGLPNAMYWITGNR